MGITGTWATRCVITLVLKFLTVTLPTVISSLVPDMVRIRAIVLTIRITLLTLKDFIKLTGKMTIYMTC